ncbi:MAG: hypothetical protein FJ405_16985 [Verrucomicrobia bacterium]|nr:hypothetical protein [Verrucomicrobiota bacterium]
MRILIAILAATSALHCAQAGLSDLEALSLIESGGNDRAIGRAGEVSRFQILPGVWRSYTKSREYQSRWLAAEVARQHLGVLKDGFARQTGRHATDFDVYVMWNAGLGYYRQQGFDPRRVHRVIRERAGRFVNLKRYSPMTQPTFASAGTWPVASRPDSSLLTPR